MSSTVASPGRVPTPMSGRSRRTESSSEGSSSRGPFGISNVKFRVGAPALRLLPLETTPASDFILEVMDTTLTDEAERILEAFGIEAINIDLVNRNIKWEPLTVQPTLMITAPWTSQSHRNWERVVKEIKTFTDNYCEDLELEDVDITIEMLAPELIMPKYLSPIIDQPDLECDWPTIMEQVDNILDNDQYTKGHMTAISLFRLGFDQFKDNNPMTVYISLGYECLETRWPPVVGAIEDYLQTLKYNLVLHMEHNTMELRTREFKLLPPAEHDQADKMDKGYERLRIIEGEYESQANLGADIGASRYLTRNDQQECNPTLGTLGCWLEIKVKGPDEWEKVALTNYHVVRPCLEGFAVKAQLAKDEKESLLNTTFGRECLQLFSPSLMDVPVAGSDLAKVDAQGYWPTRSEQPFAIESPSRSKHNMTISEAKKELQSLEKDLRESRSADEAAEIKQDIVKARGPMDRKLAFFDTTNHLLGKLYTASGFARRNDKNGRLDWALFQLRPDRDWRLGQNLLPRGDAWAHKYAFEDRPSRRTFGQPLRDPPTYSLHDGNKTRKVFKVGAISGITSGNFSYFKTKTTMDHDAHIPGLRRKSKEFVFIGKDSKGYGDVFSLRGDSGAVLFDEEGRIVGLLFSGQEPHNEKGGGYTLVTPIEDVFKDIKKMSKNQITDIRVAVAS